MVTDNDFRRVANTIADLYARGFNLDFVLLYNRLFCAQTQSFFNINEFDILEIYGLDDDDPRHGQTVIYAIDCRKKLGKGILFHNTHYGHKDLVFTNLKKVWK